MTTKQENVLVKIYSLSVDDPVRVRLLHIFVQEIRYERI